MDKKIILPGLNKTYQFAMMPFAVLFVFIFVPMSVVSSFYFRGRTIEGYLLILLITVFVLYLIATFIISKYKTIQFDSNQIKFEARFGKNISIDRSQIISIDHYEFLRIYIENYRNEFKEEILPDVEGRDYEENIEKIMSGIETFVYPVQLKTKSGSYFFLIDEKTITELKSVFKDNIGSSSKTTGILKYNEKWNWLIFAIAIFGICFAFVYIISHTN